MMLPISWRRAALAGALALAAPGCPGPKSGTDVGNGATVSVKLRAFEPPAARAQALALADGARIDALYMVVENLVLSPCDGGDDLGVDGPVVADLLTGRVVAGTSSFDVASGAYCGFKLTFAKLDPEHVPAGTPPGLADRSILVQGRRADGVPFVVASPLGVEVELAPTRSSFTISRGEDPLFLAFDVTPWMAALDLAGSTADPILVDDQHDTQRLEAFDAAVTLSAHLFRDENADGELSPGEAQPGNELAD
ncbi:MAG TPA: hypothetical protein VHB21_13025 [Minicystis sp.]|nr:hypothetical protein [Minicystis sp.]